jgi:hypothetical protein
MLILGWLLGSYFGLRQVLALFAGARPAPVAAA